MSIGRPTSEQSEANLFEIHLNQGKKEYPLVEDTFCCEAHVHAKTLGKSKTFIDLTFPVTIKAGTTIFVDSFEKEKMLVWFSLPNMEFPRDVMNDGVMKFSIPFSLFKKAHFGS